MARLVIFVCATVRVVNNAGYLKCSVETRRHEYCIAVILDYRVGHISNFLNVKSRCRSYLKV